ncbi:hypothetical protein F5146DRAFT_1073330 [Armillaria mellea]|nr:hypothetical protein F5146DRAFT_1073330 [Armillaria mellea]
MCPSSPAKQPLTNLLGCIFGVTNLQGVIYYRRYPNDLWVYHYSIGFLWALDTVHVTSSTYAVYFFLIHFFGDLNGTLEYNSRWVFGQRCGIKFTEDSLLQDHEGVFF